MGLEESNKTKERREAENTEKEAENLDRER